MFILYAVIIAVVLIIGIYVSVRIKERREIRDSLQLKLFLIRLPRETQEGRELKKEINLSEQFFNNLLAFKVPFIFEVAVPYIGEEIHFYAAFPDRFSESFARTAQSIWKDAQVDPIEDYNIFNSSGAVSGAYVKQKEKFILPIRTYQELETETFAPLLGGLSKIQEFGEGGVIQYIFRPAKKEAKKIIFNSLITLKKGGKLKDVLSHSVSISDLKKATLEGTKKSEQKEKLIDETAIRALEMKLSKPLFEVSVRILSSAPSHEAADMILEGTGAGFSQFGTPEGNEFDVVKQKDLKDIVHSYSFRLFNEENKMILNTEELASIFHLPTPFTNIPKVRELKFKEVSPPPNLPKEGIKIGESRYRNEKRDVRMTREDRRRHVYVIGQTGTGKTVFLNNLVGQDMEKGEGVCVIDPNGDLFEDLLARVPQSRVKDVVVFDPADMERPLGLNMLEYDPNFPEQKTFIINELMGIFDTLYDLKTTGGPMFEQYTRNALLLLMDDPSDGYTILEIPRVLADAEFRKKLLAKCKNIIAKDFWEKEAEKAGGEAALSNLVPYITSKFNTFIANDYVRPIIAQSKTTLKFREIIDEGKILLINLSKGKIGDLNAGLLGMILVGKITIASFSRADIPMEKRRDFYLFIDEFQNFTTPSIATILSEARKYRLCLTIAHQFIAQLSEKIRDAVFGNVGSIVAFRVGADDAEYLVKQFEPVFNVNNLLNIDNLNAHAKLMINGQVTNAFNMFEPFPPKGSADTSELARDYSRLTYGRPRETVEQEIYARLRGKEVQTSSEGNKII